MRHLLIAVCLCLGLSLLACSVEHHIGVTTRGITKEEEGCLIRELELTPQDVPNPPYWRRDVYPVQSVHSRISLLYSLERVDGATQLTYAFHWINSPPTAADFKGPSLLSKIKERYLEDRARMERCVAWDRLPVSCTLQHAPIDDAACRALFELPAATP